MGIAVDPRYPEPTYIFVHYTAKLDTGQKNRIVRFNVDHETPAQTATPILTGIPVRDTNTFIHRG